MHIRTPFHKVIYLHVKNNTFFANSYYHVRRFEKRNIKEDNSNLLKLYYCNALFVVYQVDIYYI